MPRKSKRIAKKKKTKAGDRRQSVGAALGLTPDVKDAANLNEALELGTALAAARHLNEMASQQKTKKGRSAMM